VTNRRLALFVLELSGVRCCFVCSGGGRAISARLAEADAQQDETPDGVFEVSGGVDVLKIQ
jgi:hypothetical protein